MPPPMIASGDERDEQRLRERRLDETLNRTACVRRRCSSEAARAAAAAGARRKIVGVAHWLSANCRKSAPSATT